MIDLKAKTPTRIAFEDALRKYVVGQDAAIEQVSKCYERINANIVDDRKPLCTMLFLGPTGVGKTLLCDAVAEALHGNVDHKLVINCAEYSEDHAISRLIGSPPGYIGHDSTEPFINPMSLTRGWVDKGPKISLLLFDEVEKASPKLHQLMLGITGKAELTNGRNQLLKMDRCMIFLTSNVGSREINQDHIGFKRYDVEENFHAVSSGAVAAAKRQFDPEFLGRITDTVVFRNLTETEMESILDKELWFVYERALRTMITNPKFEGAFKNIFRIATTDRLRKFLLDTRLDKEKGARSLTRMVSEHIELPLATIIATAQVTEPGVVVFDVENGEVVAEFKHGADDSRIVIAGVEKFSDSREELPVEVTPELLEKRLGKVIPFDEEERNGN